MVHFGSHFLLPTDPLDSTLNTKNRIIWWRGFEPLMGKCTFFHVILSFFSKIKHYYHKNIYKCSISLFQSPRSIKKRKKMFVFLRGSNPRHQMIQFFVFNVESRGSVGKRKWPPKWTTVYGVSSLSIIWKNTALLLEFVSLYLRFWAKLLCHNPIKNFAETYVCNFFKNFLKNSL